VIGSAPVFQLGQERIMQRPSAQEFLLTLLEALEDLPPDFSRRFADLLNKKDEDRAQAIRQLFEEFAGD
jgi:hypothetical protein